MTEVHQPLYARMLRLRHVAPSGFLCFVYLEGAVALGILLALAELVSWWGVLALPATVAVMVKLNDVIAGTLTQGAMPQAARERATLDEPASGPMLRPAFERAPHAGPEFHRAPHAGPDFHRAPHAGPGFARAAGAGPAFERGRDAGPPNARPAFDHAPYGGSAFESAPGGQTAFERAPAGQVSPDDATRRLPGVIDGGWGAPIKRPWVEKAEAQQQWIRQSATRRYE